MYRSNSRSSQYRIGSLLLSKGLISQEQLSEAIAFQQTNKDLRLGQILVDRGYISARQLRKTLNFQSWARKAACVLAFTLAPCQLVTAKEIVEQPILLPSWDKELAHGNPGFDAGFVNAEVIEGDFLPVGISLDDVKDAYMLVTGQKSREVSAQGFAKTSVSAVDYDVEVISGGGMRFNMQYHF